MKVIYRQLFDSYGYQALEKAENFDSYELEKSLDGLRLDGEARLALMDLFRERHYQWSLDAFALGLHLGLSLLNDNIRRPGTQKG